MEYVEGGTEYLFSYFLSDSRAVASTVGIKQKGGKGEEEFSNERTVSVGGGGNKNRLSSTTCGEELHKIFKDWQSFNNWQSFKGLSKIPKRFTDFERFAVFTFTDL